MTANDNNNMGTDFLQGNSRNLSASYVKRLYGFEIGRVEGVGPVVDPGRFPVGENRSRRVHPYMPLHDFVNGKLFEVQKYVNQTRHIFNFAYVLYSEPLWKKLSAADQKLVREAVKHGSFWQIDWAEENESKFVRDLEPRASKILAEIRKIVAETK